VNHQAAFPPVRQVPLPAGGWLNVREQMGQGPTLVLLHGFTDCADSFRLIAPYLAGRHLVVPDLRGHGGSFRADKTGLSDLAKDIEDLAQILGLTETVVIGHSMGALVALILASGPLKPKGLVVLSGSLQPASPNLTQIAEQFAALPQSLQADHPFLDQWYACPAPVARCFLDRLRASCIAMRPSDWANCLEALAGADLRPLARGICIPALAVSGALDPIFPPDHSAALHQHLRPQMELVLREVGHNPHWEDPQQVAAAVLSFLDQFVQVG
jgi:pimeloyl-ACP methyl ester carboxylesterase